MNFYEKQVDTTIKVLEQNSRKHLKCFPMEYIACEYKKNNDLPEVTSEWKTEEQVCYFQGSDEHYWIHTKVQTPPKVADKKVVLSITTGLLGWDADNPQCIIYIDGKIACAMDRNHTEYQLDFDKNYDIFIYYYTGIGQYTKDNAAKFKVSTVLIDEPVLELYYDMDIPHKAALCFNETDEEFLLIIKHLGIAANLIDFCNIGSERYYESIYAALEYMKNTFYKKVCKTDSPVVVSGIGHTHIDVAWKWTYAQTKEKVQRSFATVLVLMDKYPEYKFMSSQPQLYQYLKEEAPDLYEKVKEKIREGRWEVEGGMWLEADCNLISGESMIRQFLHGKRFISEEFGKESKILWLPDVFGYSAAMPQILKKCGIEAFFTSKISWNESNQIPYDTFYWQGIDGTEVFAYFATAQDYHKNEPAENHTTYVALFTPAEIKGTWNRYQQKEYNTEVISTFGYGDGGGGTTERMLETQRRTTYGIPGIPRTQIDFASNTLKRVRKTFDENCLLLKERPKWCGELYLEFHRGTYTNMAENKKFNRQCEFLYQYAEAISVFDMLFSNGKYDAELLDKNWKIILLNQFHDVIPGSSIKEVYDDSRKMYQALIADGEQIIEKKMSAIASVIDAKDGILVFNPTGFEQSGIVIHQGKKYFCNKVPAFGWKNFVDLEDDGDVVIRDFTAENQYYILSLDQNGNIATLYDKVNQREVLRGAGNCIELYEDRPYDFDGWELSQYHKHKCRTITEISSITQFNDNVCGGFVITRKFSNSVLVQRIVLYSDIPRIDFETDIDWHEDNVVLKAFFPVNVFATKATYDIQFGNIERPTHRNTSWDQAKFEVCAHKWADVSDYGYGVSLLNDCKYGYSVEENNMRLTLLKAANDPNPESDRGKHHFTYSLLPHKGDFRVGGVIKEAYILNNPLRSVVANGQRGTLPAQYSVVQCDKDNVVIDTIKKAEEGDDIVVRMFESYNCVCDTIVTFGFDVKCAYLCDMLENEETELDVINNQVCITLRNYEIVTIKVKPGEK